MSKNEKIISLEARRKQKDAERLEREADEIRRALVSPEGIIVPGINTPVRGLRIVKK